MFPSSFQNQTVVGFHVSAYAHTTVKTNAHAARDSRAEGEALLVETGEHACADREAARDERLGDRAALGRDRN
jgi:hypothetical protein